ncbi:hypothetical protein RHMOL_Rhmol03G0071700 [Rhododendron molle]|uniref:Uncharacterized protein n=1 Tax=Rhododendron molle TaxID=49168 RepID=A0ACC0PCI9_RHOML|nr:hypothetical protein RHMOL_Rhmol03G0071700 [Rhododendron molle]
MKAMTRVFKCLNNQEQRIDSNQDFSADLYVYYGSSLTEAFCIAILEAASCGLLTVSTRVGGVPEAWIIRSFCYVLPEDMIVLAKPDPVDMVQAIQKAICILPNIDPHAMHLRMKKLYSWHNVAKRTEIVYDRALRCSNQNLLERLSRYLTCGAWAGKLFCLVMVIDFLLWHLLKVFQPAADIEVVPDIITPPCQHGEKSGDANAN